MSLEINLFIKNQWQESIVVTCVLITKRKRQESIGVFLCIIFGIESWLKSWYIQKIQSYHYLEAVLSVMNDMCFHLASLCSPFRNCCCVWVHCFLVFGSSKKSWLWCLWWVLIAGMEILLVVDCLYVSCWRLRISQKSFCTYSCCSIYGKAVKILGCT